MTGEYRTDENPFGADDQQQQHLLRAMELVEKEALGGQVDQRTLYDAVAHLRMAAVKSIMEGDD